MIDIVNVNVNNEAASNHLSDLLKGLDIDGTLFIGHPIVEDADEKIEFDAVLASSDHGVIGFDFNDPAATDAEELEKRQDSLHHALQRLLMANRNLLERRVLAVPITIITITERKYPDAIYQDINVCTPDILVSVLEDIQPMNEKYLGATLSALQNATTFKPQRKRPEAITEGSKGSAIKEIE